MRDALSRVALAEQLSLPEVWGRGAKDRACGVGLLQACAGKQGTAWQGGQPCCRSKLRLDGFGLVGGGINLAAASAHGTRSAQAC